MTHGVRTEHYGQHGPTCFGCKLKSISFGSLKPAEMNGKNRWENDPVKQRIEELNGVSIDTDAMNKRLAESTPK